MCENKETKKQNTIIIQLLIFKVAFGEEQAYFNFVAN